MGKHMEGKGFDQIKDRPAIQTFAGVTEEVMFSGEDVINS
jgi:hypothetical protein